MLGMFEFSSSENTEVPPPVTLPAPLMDKMPLSLTLSVGKILLIPSPIA